MRNPPTVVGAYQSVLVPAGDDVVGPTAGGGRADMLRLEVTAVCRRVAVDDHLMITNQVLAPVEVFQCFSDSTRDRFEPNEIGRARKMRSCVREKHLTQQCPVLRVKRTAVEQRGTHDVSFVEQQLQIRINVHAATF